MINDVTHSGILLNFSRGGFFIMTSLSQSLDPGQAVSLNFYSRTTRDRIYFDGTVVRKEATGIGVAI